MPDTGPLIELGRRLQLAMDPGAVFRAPVWGDPQRMSDELRELARSFNSIGALPPAADIHRAVLAFAHQGGAKSFTELKHVCHGITMPLNDDGRCLLHSAKIFGLVIEAVEGERPEPRRFRRCYQALLQSYFAYTDVTGLPNASVASGNFNELRIYLSNNLPSVAHITGKLAAPAWVNTLKDHANLLTDDPCSRYVAELIRGKSERLATVCDVLGIHRESWVWREVIQAYLRDVCERDDKAFGSVLPRALELADGKTDLKLNDTSARAVMAALVKRYERSTAHPEHPRLRDLAVTFIGNPWLKKTAWDAWVKHEPARKMVDGWLKVRLIRDFFELLSQDGAADQRRLDYWLRFESVIDDMWFVLGEDARGNKSAEFKELRSRMTGRDRVLAGNTTSDNNAFVMRIGKLLLIEFGVTGNACFVINADDFRTDLEHRHLSVPELKQSAHSTKLTHQSTWEVKFDNEICPRIGFWPGGRSMAGSVGASTTAPSRGGGLPEFLGFCRSRGVKYEDLRSKGGSLWVYADPEPNNGLARWLNRLGFKRKAGRGYWLA